jgi:transcriptional regulator with XRE-family HTH domain
LYEPDWEHVAAKVRQRLIARHLSQREFARIVGVTPQTVTNWLGGGQINSDRLPAVAATLRISIDELLGASAAAQDHEAMQIASSLGKLAADLEPLKQAAPDLIELLTAARRYVGEP